MRRILHDKGGQYFIIAAIIIIVVIVSFVAISNFSQRRDTTRLYDLGQELGIESQQVIDYGTYSQLDETQMKILMESFIKTYADYIGETGNLYFAYGNSRKIFTVAYQEYTDESACIKLNPKGASDDLNENEVNAPCITLEVTQLEEGTPHSQEFPALNDDIIRIEMDVAGIPYQFRLKEGENFYFIIWQQIGEERHVITSPQG